MRIGSHFFAYLSRMRFIQRWALMRNTGLLSMESHNLFHDLSPKPSIQTISL